MNPKQKVDQINSLRQQANNLECSFLNKHRRTILELAEKILLLKKKGRITAYDRDALDKMLSDQSTRTHYTRVQIATGGEYGCLTHHVGATFMYLDHEAGWLPYFDYPYSTVYIEANLLDDHTKLDALFEQKREEWRVRDEAAEVAQKEQRRQQLLAELGKL